MSESNPAEIHKVLTRGKGLQGFASMNPEKHREIARKGGKAAHEKGTAHEFTAEEAKLAGKKGGAIISQNRPRMSELGRLGGLAAAKKRREQKSDEVIPPKTFHGSHEAARAELDSVMEGF